MVDRDAVVTKKIVATLLVCGLTGSDRCMYESKVEELTP